MPGWLILTRSQQCIFPSKVCFVTDPSGDHLGATLLSAN